MNLREAKTSDIPDLVVLFGLVQDLHAKADPDTYRTSQPEKLEAVLRKVLGDVQQEIWVAEVEGQIAGYVLCVAQRRGETWFAAPRARLYVEELSVAPHAQRKGVGRALMEHVEARARALDLHSVVLHVQMINPGAVKFYEALGYTAQQIKMRRKV